MRADLRARGNGGQVLQFRALADHAAVLDHAGRADIGAVSYTHLTLPTSDLV